MSNSSSYHHTSYLHAPIISEKLQIEDFKNNRSCASINTKQNVREKLTRFQSVFLIKQKL